MKADDSNASEDSFMQNSEHEGLTNLQLHDLVHDHQRFLQTVQKFNEQAQIKINGNNPKESLPYLLQAEKILQYGASCGKNIDRALIISILHNEACAYQKSWELTKCSNYLEALILNMTEYLQLEEPQMKKKSTSSIPTCSQTFLDKSLRLTKYYLQFAAVNSQVKNHQGAYLSSKKAINLLKVVFKSLNYSFRSQAEIEAVMPYETKLQVQLKGKIVGSISSMKDEINIKNLQDYVSGSHYLYCKWQKSKTLSDCEIVQEALRKFSIGNVMQIMCDSIEEKKEIQVQNVYFNTNDSVYSQSRKLEVLKTESYLKILQKILMLSIAFFTAATELRLSTSEKYKLCLQTYKNSIEFKQSQIYHLTSLMIIFAYVPFEMQFVAHIINSYHKNYKGDIFKSDKYQDNNKYEEIIAEIDPFSIYLLYTNNQEKEQLPKKTIQVISRKSSRVEVQTPRSGSQHKQQKINGIINKLQKRCKHIINNRYPQNEKEQQHPKDDGSKSLTYINKKKARHSKSCRSKKSLSITNTISRKQNFTSRHIKLQDYYSSINERKNQTSEKGKEVLSKIKGYYDSMMPTNGQKSLKKINDIRSPKKFKQNKKKGKQKAQKSDEKKKKQQKKCSKSKSKSIKGLSSNFKLVSSIKSPVKTAQKSVRTPQDKNELLPSTQYYD